MFAFSQAQPRTDGVIQVPPIPLNRYLGEAFGQGQEDGMLDSLLRIGQFNQASTGNTITKEEANHKYGFPGMQFNDSVDEGRAKLMSERRRAEMDREWYLQQGNPGGFWSGRGLIGMGATMIGNISNPLDFASMFIPFVGEERAATALAKSGASVFRQRMARGLLGSMESFQEMGLPRIAGTMAHGAAFQAFAEIPLMVSKMQDSTDYSPGKYLMDVGVGGLFAGGLHATMSLFGKLDRGTKEAMFRKALNDTLEGKTPELRDLVKLDENTIRESVKFDENRARLQALRQIPIEDVKRAIHEEFGQTVKAAAFRDIVSGKIYRAKPGENHMQVEFPEEVQAKLETGELTLEEGFVTDKNKFVSREKAAELTGIKGRKAGIFSEDLQATGNEMTLPPGDADIYARVLEGGGSHEQARAEILKNRQAVADAHFFTHPEIQAKVEKEHARRIQEYIDKERSNYDPAKEIDARRQAEITKQIAEGKVLAPEVREKYALHAEDPSKDIPTLEEANKQLEEELGLNEPENKSGSPETKGELNLSVFDKIDKALEKLKVPDKGTLHVAGIPVLLWNGAIDAVRLAVKAGKAITEAIEEGVKHIRENWDKSAKQPDPKWRVTVQAEQKMGKLKVPGYVQIDFADNTRSTNPDTLRKEGYTLPDFSKLPQGQYTLAQATEALSKPKGHSRRELQAQGEIPEHMVEELYGKLSGLQEPEIKTPESNSGLEAAVQQFKQSVESHLDEFMVERPKIPTSFSKELEKASQLGDDAFSKFLEENNLHTMDQAAENFTAIAGTPLDPDRIPDEVYGKQVVKVMSSMFSEKLEHRKYNFFIERDQHGNLTYSKKEIGASTNPEILSTSKEFDRFFKERSRSDIAADNYNKAHPEDDHSLLEEEIKSIEEQHKAHIEAIDSALECMLRRVV